MGITALIMGLLGGLCSVWGILNAVDIIPGDLIINDLDWTFWFGLATILLLGSIAVSFGRRRE